MAGTGPYILDDPKKIRAIMRRFAGVRRGRGAAVDRWEFPDRSAAICAHTVVSTLNPSRETMNTISTDNNNLVIYW